MPCYLLVTFGDILDRAALLDMAQELGWSLRGEGAELWFQTKQGRVAWDGVHLVGPASALRGVQQLYGVHLASRRAKAKGYRVTRKNDQKTGDVQLVLLKQ